ncbi:trypsin-like peptidase domain-containing protein [Streptomyces sp. IB2014 016-6]|uniref:VMAP-C domain-containing protein n=1 Tax=Streptomyces sp. IB2014 016-6 TaxID=2517818 RepID=UPI0011C7D2AB|nr:trypsin-like peptidase domain-containing protein [Streptomyces sp. IB2014 016-6]TXL89281.1 serine protease [Streptomyces sp. IB2014 016-6]
MDPRRLALILSGTAQERRSVGSGYLIAPRLVLTARHVIEDRDTHAEWPQIQIRVGHPGEGGTVRTKATVLWRHPQDLDVALLLTADPVEVPDSPVRWGRPVGKAPLRYEGLGFPLATAEEEREVEHLRGVLPLLSSGSRARYVLDQEPAPDHRTDGRKAWGGASGAAVFCDDHVVGVVIEDNQSYGNRRLRASPAHAFVQDGEFDTLLGQYADGPPHLVNIGASLPKVRPPADRTPAEQDLELALWHFLGDPKMCSFHARSLAQELGYQVPADYAPSLSDLMALFAGHRRALASLSDTLAPTVTEDATRARLTALLTRARAAGLGSLLSLAEYERLMQLLSGICKESATLLPRAASEALRYVCLSDTLSRTHLRVDELGQFVEELEAVSDSLQVPEGTPQVPALLRLVEYVAAAVGGEQAAELREWSARVADRTGIHPTALDERRADAVRWAARQPSPVSRVVLELTGGQAPSDERYICRILVAHKDGTQVLLHESRTVAKTPEEIAVCLREAVDSAADEPGQGDHVPWVTVLVDRQGLHLAVDEWNPGAPNDFVPDRPIGAEYRMTLSCPDMSALVPGRDRDQRRRWRSGHPTPLVTDQKCATDRQLTRALATSHRDAIQVVIHGPREQRMRLLEVCLALGVPVVLWDREAEGYEDATKLRPLDPLGLLAELPERVYKFRAEALEPTATTTARPALVWEEESSHPKPESLRLRDPRIGVHVS